MDFNRCTERLREVLKIVTKEAQRSSFDYIGTEHLLMGLLQPQAGMAYAILLDWGIDPDSVHRELIEPLPRQMYSYRFPMTPRVKQALELADNMAAVMGSELIGPEHVLIGMLKTKGSSATNLLRREGLTLDWVRREIMRRSR